ncbi:MAG TPA: NAD-dependent epimerase/dehydratase family protein [Solirubrobacteraceae bacterium]|nr:NAD-dependent epimerase/dehydratase family protein [Solirubrobacteraceae bacterium]
MPRTLVTGATGFLGSRVTRLLVERGDEVRATVRPRSNARGLEELDVNTVRADVRDRRAVRGAMRDIDRVFHLAGTTNLRLSRERVFALNVEGTRVVLEEALRAGVERVVYTSSAAAIGPSAKGRVATERARWDAAPYAIPYVDSKHDAEGIALGLYGRGLPVVIVNPAHVLGAGDPGRSSTVLVRRFLRREIPAYVDGTLNVVGVEDVARGHVLADEHGLPGERYILGNRNFTLDRLFNDLARLSGVEPPSLKLPLHAALLMAEAARFTPGGVPMPLPSEVRAASLNWAFSSAKAKRELGWWTSPHEDCLEDTIAWYREREGERMSPPGARQPVVLRMAGAFARRAPLGWR